MEGPLVASPDEKSISLFQHVTRSHPPSGDDVCSVSAFAAAGRESTSRTRHRHLSRDSVVLLESFRTDASGRDPEASSSKSFVFKLVLAFERGVCANQWRYALALAGR
jgi:hypothetical protein